MFDLRGTEKGGGGGGQDDAVHTQSHTLTKAGSHTNTLVIRVAHYSNYYEQSRRHAPVALQGIFLHHHHYLAFDVLF